MAGYNDIVNIAGLKSAQIDEPDFPIHVTNPKATTKSITKPKLTTPTWSSPLLIRQNYRWLIESLYDVISLQSDKTTDGELYTAG